MPHHWRAATSHQTSTERTRWPGKMYLPLPVPLPLTHSAVQCDDMSAMKQQVSPWNGLRWRSTSIIGQTRVHRVHLLVYLVGYFSIVIHAEGGLRKTNPYSTTNISEPNHYDRTEKVCCQCAAAGVPADCHLVRPIMEPGRRATLPWASPPLVSTAMDFPDADRFSISFRVSCRFGAMVLAMFLRVGSQSEAAEGESAQTCAVRRAAESVSISGGGWWWWCSGAAVVAALPARAHTPRTKIVLRWRWLRSQVSRVRPAPPCVEGWTARWFHSFQLNAVRHLHTSMPSLALTRPLIQWQRRHFDWQIKPPIEVLGARAPHQARSLGVSRSGLSSFYPVSFTVFSAMWAQWKLDGVRASKIDTARRDLITLLVGLCNDSDKALGKTA